MADEVRLLTAKEVAQIGLTAEHWDPGAPAVPLPRDTLRRVVATLEALQADTDKVETAYQEYRKRLAHYIKAEDSLTAERDTWRAEAEDRRAEVARLQDTVVRLQTETDYLRAKLCRLGDAAVRILG